MSDQTTRDELARLRDTVLALEARQAATEARHVTEQAALRRLLARSRRSRRSRLPAIALALLLALVPTALFAANPFTDLTGGPHDANIDAIYNAGVTTGCVPNAEYCPTANVTREEMASFLARLGGLGTNPPVANAANSAALNGYAANGLVRVAHGQRQDDFNVTIAYTTHASLAITAPAAGFLLVTGSVEFIFDSGCPCTGGARLRHTEGVTESFTSAAVITPTIDRARVPLSWTFPVAAGVQHLELRVIKLGGTGSLKAVSGNIDALYVPFGSTGGATLDQP